MGSEIDEQVPIDSYMRWTLRTAQYRYIEWHHTMLHGSARIFDSNPIGIELYDYQLDPHENQNLANEVSYAGMISQHQALMDRL